MIHYIDELEKEDLAGKRVLLRLDLNVPIVDGEVRDVNRLEKVIETIDFLREKEAQTIIIAHLEDKEGKNLKLLPVWNYLNGYFPVEFCSTYFTPESIDKLLSLKDKGVLLFENVRENDGEKKNDHEFSKKLSGMADIYVNDAFSVSHRKHASVIGVPEFLPHYGGLLMRQEIEHISRAFSPKSPFVFIIGGAKFETKFPLMEKYLGKAGFVFVGGALSNTFFKEKGFEVGLSLISKKDFDLSEILRNPKLVLPQDVTVVEKDSKVVFKSPDQVDPYECIVDAGEKTVEQLRNLLVGVKTIVWNGPLGNYEAGFKDKTEALALLIAEATANGAESIVGGGDTIASINSLGINHKFSFISTGGGAMMDFLVDETLPGIQALEN